MTRKSLIALITSAFAFCAGIAFVFSDGGAGSPIPAEPSTEKLSPAYMLSWVQEMGIETRSRWIPESSSLQIDVVPNIPADYEQIFAPHQTPRIPTSASIRINNRTYTLHPMEDGILSGVVKLDATDIKPGTQFGIVVSDATEQLLDETLTILDVE